LEVFQGASLLAGSPKMADAPILPADGLFSPPVLGPWQPWSHGHSNLIHTGRCLYAMLGIWLLPDAFWTRALWLLPASLSPVCWEMSLWSCYRVRCGDSVLQLRNAWMLLIWIFMVSSSPDCKDWIME
jgi:hypothetical protein